MAGWHQVHRQTDSALGFHEDPRPILYRVPGPLPPHPAILEEELEMQHRDIQKIHAENGQLVDENAALHREVMALRDEMYRLSQVIPKVRADNEAHIRELVDRGSKIEADLRAVEPLRAEVVQLRAESQKLNLMRQELSAQVRDLTKDINRAKADNQQVVAMKADIEQIHKELAEARRVLEFEKKPNEELVAQNQAMEKNFISMSAEIDKLRTEQVNAERRAQVPGVSGYGLMNTSPELRHQGNPYSDPYARKAWAPYDTRGPRMW